MPNSSKILACIPVYQGSEYLEYVLNSIKDTIFDKILILEGAYKVVVEQGYPARSTDETLNIIDKFVDNKKIFLKQVNEHSQPEHCQNFLDFGNEYGMDILWVVDSDEIWKRETLNKVLPLFENKKIYSWRPSSYNFINDFNHYYDGNYCRIHRITPKAKWIGHNSCRWEDADLPEFNGRPAKHIMELPKSIRFYHYAYVRKLSNFDLKNNACKATWWTPGMPKFEAMKYYQYVDGKYQLPPDIKIYEFNGQHPEIMLTHPYYSKSVAEINAYK